MQKFARVLSNKMDLMELSLKEACMWACEVLSVYKVFVERVLDQNLFELLMLEVLETL